MRTTLDRLQARRRDEAGFTLIELLIVIVILGVLAAIVVFSVRGITDKGDVSACKTEIRTVETAYEAAVAQGAEDPDLDYLIDEGFLRSEPKYVTAVDETDVSLTGAPDGCEA